MSIEIKNGLLTVNLADMEKLVNEQKKLAAAFTEQAKKVENELMRLKELKKSVKQENETAVERAGIGDRYYYIDFGVDMGVCVLYGIERQPGISSYLDKDNDRNKAFFEHNNYFHTSARTHEVADKIKFLLKLERLHDTYCPDYVPDWDFVSELKYYVSYDIGYGKYTVRGTNDNKLEMNVYFATREIAEKVCEVLNAELNKNEGE